jgi:hypothetical protein
MQDLGEGLTMLRTAFELAFENWRLARHLTDVPGDVPVPRPPAPSHPSAAGQRGGGRGSFY